MRIVFDVFCAAIYAALIAVALRGDSVFAAYNKFADWYNQEGDHEAS